MPVEVATEISKRTKLLLWSMGSGPGCDAQYLFAEDVLGANRGHMPRHSKVYRNFAAEFDKPQRERVKAFSEYIADAESGAYPEQSHVIRMPSAELLAFGAGLKQSDPKILVSSFQRRPRKLPCTIRSITMAHRRMARPASNPCPLAAYWSDCSTTEPRPWAPIRLAMTTIDRHIRMV